MDLGRQLVASRVQEVGQKVFEQALAQHNRRDVVSMNERAPRFLVSVEGGGAAKDHCAPRAHRRREIENVSQALHTRWQVVV